MTDKIISQEEFNKVADLARITLGKQEKEKLTLELNSVLDYFKDLSQVPADNVENFDHYQLTENQLRDDIVQDMPEDEREVIRKQFPGREDNYLKVKAVLK